MMLSSGKYIIAVDFDGTLVEAKWPGIGAPNKELFKRLITHQQRGDIIILWTARSRQYLQEAVDFCISQGLKPDYVNENCKEWLDLDDLDKSDESRKITADIYIDDKGYQPEIFLKNSIKSIVL